MDVMTRRKMVDLVPAGYWGKDVSNIHLICNFLTDEEAIILNKYVKNIDDWTGNQNDATYQDRIHLNLTLEIRRIIENLFTRMKKNIELKFPVTVIPNGPSICKWKTNDWQPVHADKQLQDGSPNCQQDQDIASVIYINDASEYEGGELYFPNQSLNIKPVAKLAAFFPGDIHYSHGVTKVISGTRYTIPFFWKVIKVK